MQTDPIMAEIITAGAPLRNGGDRVSARVALEAVWAKISADPKPLHAMALAHTLADAQDDPAEELAWDIRALEAAGKLTDADVADSGPGQSIRAFMPSLHVNLAEDYFKLGDRARSQEHVDQARQFIDALADDAYGQLIRRGLDRMTARLAQA
jgi:hypothetical protein